MNCYMSQFFNEDALNVPNFKLSSLNSYVIPDDGPLSLYKEVCAGLPPIDRPEAFGQHPNADIASAITSGNAMLETVVSLQPRTADASGISPEPINIAAKAGESDGSALYIVLVQELQRHNA